MSKRAFTLVEILTVIGIVAIISSLGMSALQSAKKEAKKATCISNLHQCGIALTLYCSENGDAPLPTIATARVVLADAPTCDPNDTWRKSCSEALGDPLVGSYAYVRGTPLFEGSEGGRWLQANANPLIMVSSFYANPPLPRFHGDNLIPEVCTQAGFASCPMPRGLLGLRMDGSVSQLRIPNTLGHDIQFSWTEAFLSDSDFVEAPH